MTPIFRNLIELLVNPFFICLFLLGLCFWFAWRRIYGNFISTCLLSVLLLFLVISTGWLPKCLTELLERQYPVVTKLNPQIKWVVVLSGGQSQVKGMPANSLLHSASIKRLVEGVRLVKSLPQAHLLLSGGGYGGDQPEAMLLAELASWFAIPAQKVVLEKKSINTADQAKEIQNIVKNKPFYLVTSAIHMPRAMALFEQKGMHPIAAPTDFTFFWHDERWGKMFVPNTYNMSYLTIALHELLGRIWATPILANTKSM